MDNTGRLRLMCLLLVRLCVINPHREIVGEVDLVNEVALAIDPLQYRLEVDSVGKAQVNEFYHPENPALILPRADAAGGQVVSIHIAKMESLILQEADLERPQENVEVPEASVLRALLEDRLLLLGVLQLGSFHVTCLLGVFAHMVIDVSFRILAELLLLRLRLLHLNVFVGVPIVRLLLTTD